MNPSRGPDQLCIPLRLSNLPRDREHSVCGRVMPIVARHCRAVSHECPTTASVRFIVNGARVENSRGPYYTVHSKDHGAYDEQRFNTHEQRPNHDSETNSRKPWHESGRQNDIHADAGRSRADAREDQERNEARWQPSQEGPQADPG